MSTSVSANCPRGRRSAQSWNWVSRCCGRRTRFPRRRCWRGRTRRCRSKRLECRWAGSGADHPVSALALEVEGSSKPWFLVTSACELDTAQLVEAYAARYRQEDGFRDHKQLLGMEECRAWTKEPILRTFQVRMVTMTLLRLLQFRLDALGAWWGATVNRRVNPSGGVPPVFLVASSDPVDVGEGVEMHSRADRSLSSADACVYSSGRSARARHLVAPRWTSDPVRRGTRRGRPHPVDGLSGVTSPRSRSRASP